MQIRPDDLSDPRVHRLLDEHLQEMARHSPPGSIHALDLDGLRAPGLGFWTAWRGEELLGCGALKALGDDHGEIKSMRTARAHRRQGVAAGLLAHLIGEARGRGWRRLSLETGSMPAFAPAHALYARSGFRPCAPFAGYVEDPHSLFMTLDLDDGSATGARR